MLAGFERYQTMKQSARLTCTVIGFTLMAAPNVFAASFSLRIQQPSQPAPKFTVKRFQRSSQPSPQFTVNKFERLTQPASQFTVRRYQRPMRSQRRFVALQRRESRTTRFRNSVPSNQQIRTGRNRHYQRPQRTKLSRDPSLRIAGRQRTVIIRRHSRWASNR